MTVYGSAIMRTEPDVAMASLSISRVDKEPAEAFEATRGTVQAVRKALAASDVTPPDIEISRVAIAEENEYHPVHKLIGYRASVTFRVRLRELDLIEPVLVAAVGAGANHVEGVGYGTSRLRELRADARREAVTAARGKAEVYCEAAGCRIGAVAHIEDVNPDAATTSRGGRYATTPALEAETDEARTFGSGSLTIAAAVMIVYGLLPD